METRQAAVLLFAAFSCYLIISLTPASAYQAGEIFSFVEGKRARFSIEPALRIIDELKPVQCGSAGALVFRAYAENVGEFGITGSEALIEDVSSGLYYNVTDALTCAPMANLISNQEIVCSLNIRTLLAKLSACPLDSIDNRLYVSFEISQDGVKSKMTDTRSLTIVSAGVEPSMEVDFAVSHPPYQVPRINCKTGSEIDIPLVIRHAETLFGDISWSFVANATSSNMIECSKVLTRTGEGREDIYLCTLTVASTMFPACEEDFETTVRIQAKSGGYNMTGQFSTTLTSEDLQLRLSVSGLGKVECQIVDEDGLCIPRDPQRNVTVVITGNVPERLKVFESRYKIDNGNTSTLLCRKMASSRYECMTFISLDRLPAPSDKNSTTTKTREITVYFDVKYLNYYSSISARTQFEMEGRALDELINTIRLLEESKHIFNEMGKISKRMNTAYTFMNTILGCCLLISLLDSMVFGGLKDVINEFGRTFLWGNAQNVFGKAFGLLVGNGPALLGCIAGEALEEIDAEIKNLNDFENGTITQQLDMPNIGDMMLSEYPACRAQNFWSQVKSTQWKLLCGAFLILISIAIPGAAGAVCAVLNSPAVGAIGTALNALLAIASILLLILTYEGAMKNLALARERINLQLAAANAMTDYAQALQNTMEALATSLSANAALLNITTPAYGTVKLIFISGNSGILDNGDSICSKDQIAIDYDFEKLNQIEGFRSELFIASSSRSKTLHFDRLKGTYGPYETDILLGTDPLLDPSEPYTFRLLYEGKSLAYELNYMNTPCGP